MHKLVNSYEKRMKNFVLKLAENPGVLRGNTNNTKKLKKSYHPLLTVSPNNISIKKNFSIKNYKPEKERIKEIILNKTIIEQYIEQFEKAKNKRALKYKKTHEPKLIQPSMRYRSRTDIERIYDIIRNSENYYVQKNKIKKHLDKIELKANSMEDNIYDEYDLHNANILNENLNTSIDEKKYINNSNKILKEIKTIYNKKKFLLNVLDNNKVEKNINNKYLKEQINHKTNFKAMENIKMFKTSTVNHNIFKKIQLNNLTNGNNRNNFPLLIKIKNKKIFNNKINIKEKIPILRKINSVDELNKDINIKNSTNSYSDISNINLRKKSFYINKDKEDINNYIHLINHSYAEDRHFNIDENKNILKDYNIIKEIANENPLFYNINYIIDKKKDRIIDLKKEDLNKLKKLAFEKYEKMEKTLEENSNNKDKELNKNSYEDLQKDENIIIDGKRYKKTDIDKIAGKLLQKYNWDENEVKYSPKDGGLMFTNGLSIREFAEKYGC